jgi:hypothetical protein
MRSIVAGRTLEGMILLYPLVLGAAIVLVVRRGGAGHRTGWPWFLAWTASGALFFFSFLTGFSIGLFVLPFAAVLLIWTARRAPHWAEGSGFLLGVGLVTLLVGWLAPGVVVSLVAVSAYGTALARRERLS